MLFSKRNIGKQAINNLAACRYSLLNTEIQQTSHCRGKQLSTPHVILKASLNCSILTFTTTTPSYQGKEKVNIKFISSTL